MNKIFLFCIYLLLQNISLSQDIHEITILHWNDFHARNMPEKITKTDTSTGEKVTYLYGGTSNMLGYVNMNRTSNTIVLNAGDDFQGTPVSNLTRGKSQVELLNLFGLDAFTVGNHEFDYGDTNLDSVLKQANFEYLSANVFFKPANSTFGKPLVVKEVNGIKAGIIGITLPDLFQVSLPKNIENVAMLDEDSVIIAAVSVLKKEECDLIILLTHQGIDEDKVTAEKFFRDVDVIVGGHSHTPLFRPVVKNGVIIVQAGSYSRWLGKLDLKVDADRDTVVGYFGKLIETVMDSAIFDRNAQAKVEEMIASAGPEMKRVIGRLETDWKASYSEESNLGQFEADAFRIAAGTDIAFINGGGLRKSLPSGDITVSDIWEINPFGNEVMVFSITGKHLREMIKNNIRMRVEKQLSGSALEMLNVSGLNYSYDSKKVIDGKDDFLMSFNLGRSAIDDNLTYSVSTNSYITSQFKKFFGEVSQLPEFKSTGLIDRDIIIEAVEKLKVINTVLERRVVDVSK